MVFSRYYANKCSLHSAVDESVSSFGQPAGRPFSYVSLTLPGETQASRDVFTAILDTGFNGELLISLEQLETIFFKRESKELDDRTKTEFFIKTLLRDVEEPQRATLKKTKRGPVCEIRLNCWLYPFRANTSRCDRNSQSAISRIFSVEVLLPNTAANIIRKKLRIDEEKSDVFVPPSLPLFGTKAIEETGLELLVADSWFSFYMLGRLNAWVRSWILPHGNLDI